MKPIGDMWKEIEADLDSECGSAKGPGLLTRLATSDTGQRLRVGVEWPSKARVLLFSAQAAALPPKAAWPECRGLELLLDSKPSGEVALIVRLRDLRGQDVFTVLAEDLARRAVGGSEWEAARRVLSALGRWQKFLAVAGRSLSDEARRGLWGELWTLEHVIIPSIGIEAAVGAWRGPAGAPQDFQHQGTAIEVKTRAACSPAVVRISSEQQLHDTPWQNLFLNHIAVDEQDGAGETLPQRIASLRHLVAATAAAELLEDALVDAGWLEAEAEKHQMRGFVRRELDAFRVAGHFPRLTPLALPPGVGGVCYDLSLDAVQHFAQPVADMQHALDPTKH
ncbi:MAG: PD-(D/E)XK motif protein [Verrucomicrobia bacterium]|nr:PD-(D/E)XK motif protein [Verrucomicrobiota bacterium]